MVYILGGTALNYVGHRDSVRGASVGERKEWKYLDMADLDRQRGISVVQDRRCLHRAMENGMCLSAIPNALMARIFLVSNSGIILASDMGRCLRISQLPVIATVRSYLFGSPYHDQRVALLWSDMKTLQMSGAPLDTGP